MHYSNAYFSFYNYNFENKTLIRPAKSSFILNKKNKMNKIQQFYRA